MRRRDFTAGLGGWGVARDRVHTEIFGSGKSLTPGVKNAPRRLPHAPAGSPGKGPSISFARAGLTVSWDRKFQSLLELAEACDVPTRWSCRTGVCHTCECGLISGSVKYDPEPLEPLLHLWTESQIGWFEIPTTCRAIRQASGRDRSFEPCCIR